MGFINILFIPDPRAQSQAHVGATQMVRRWAEALVPPPQLHWKSSLAVAQGLVFFRSLAAAELNEGNQEASAGGWRWRHPPSIELPFLFVSLFLSKTSTLKCPHVRQRGATKSLLKEWQLSAWWCGCTYGFRPLCPPSLCPLSLVCPMQASPHLPLAAVV